MHKLVGSSYLRILLLWFYESTSLFDFFFILDDSFLLGKVAKMSEELFLETFSFFLFLLDLSYIKIAYEVPERFF